MTRARKTLVDPEATSYYHCIGRCVWRAWLWGEDRVSGRNYEHRKNWVVARLGGPDGVTLLVRFCEGDGTYWVTGIPVATLRWRGSCIVRVCERSRLWPHSHYPVVLQFFWKIDLIVETQLRN